MKTKLYTLITLLAIFTYQLSAQNTELWGTTRAGGNSNNGTIFKTDANGDNHTVVYAFPFSNEGGAPKYTKLCKASNGKLYGMTNTGGANNEGVIFSYDPDTEIYNKEFDFDDINSGKWPTASLVEVNDGKLYGMTSQGGTYNYGILFSFDPTTSVFSKKIDFDGTNRGRAPYGSLIQANNGKLYGMTLYGGTVSSIGYGVLFEYDPITDIFVKKIDFDGLNKGTAPYGSLLQANDNKLYGMTTAGGANNMGVVFSFDLTASTFTKVIDFDGANNGRSPYGSLIQANDGKLYGMTYLGGINGFGILFSYDYTTTNFVKELDFDLTITGGRPYGDLIQLNNDKLYGMNSIGGSNNKGVLFSYNPITTTFSNEFNFDGTNNGETPSGSLITGNDGNIYGLTTSGGSGSNGVLFKYDPILNNFEKKIDLNYAENGRYIYGGLLEATNGFLYGMTTDGGAYDLGVIFSINPVTYKVTKEFDFDGTNNGSRPYGNLIEANNGKLYGMTYQGGANNHGVIFEYNPLNKFFNKLVDFNNSTIGGYARGSLMQSSNGKLYGLTSSGGVNSSGVLFEYEIGTNTYVKKIDFNATNGSSPYVSLIEASNGKFYGLTSSGGAYSKGTLFEYDFITNTLIIKVSISGGFSGSGYSNPRGSLVEGSDGIFYGTLYNGGSNSSGGMFKYSLTSGYYNLNSYSTYGKNPSGTLMEAINGKFYGVTRSGGNNGLGVLLEYDSTTNTFAKKLDFNGTNGSNPEYTSLIEIQKPLVWTATNEWSNITGPTINDKVLIEGDLSVGTDFGTFSALSLSIASSGSLTIEPNNSVTVKSQVTNLATQSDFIIESGASLVQIDDYTNEGIISVKRESAPIIRLDYTAWGSPVEGQNLLDFSPNTLANRFYTYDPAGTTTSTSWISVPDPSTSIFSSAKGYLVRAPNNWSSTIHSPFLGDFIGKPNNGIFKPTVTVGFNLLGNPYPSPINANSFLNDNATLGVSSLYFWTHAVPQNSSYVAQTNYASYNLSGGTAAIAGGSQPDGYIQVGQGFLANIATSGDIEFNNLQRSDVSNNQFFKTTSIPNRIWLGLTGNNESYNQILIAYLDGSSNDFDLGYDAKLLTNGSSFISSIINAEDYVIQGRNSVFDEDDEVLLGFTAQQTGNYTISLDSFDGLFANQDVYLWDKNLNIYHNLKVNDYSFTSAQGIFNNRFSIVYLSTLNSPKFVLEDVLVYKNDEGLNILANNKMILGVKIYDLQGRILKSFEEINQSEIILPNVSSSNSILLVEIETDKGNSIKKIIN